MKEIKKMNFDIIIDDNIKISDSKDNFSFLKFA